MLLVGVSGTRPLVGSDVGPMFGVNEPLKVSDVGRCHNHIVVGRCGSEASGLGREYDIAVERSIVGGWVTLVPCERPELRSRSQDWRGQRLVAESVAEFVQPNNAQALAGADEFSAYFIVSNLRNNESSSSSDVAARPLLGVPRHTVRCRIAQQPKGPAVEDDQHVRTVVPLSAVLRPALREVRGRFVHAPRCRRWQTQRRGPRAPGMLGSQLGQRWLAQLRRRRIALPS